MPPEKPDPDKDKSAAQTPETVRRSEELRADMDAAWFRWSHAMRDVDVEPRMLVLLRAAFQAGWKARG